MSFLKNIGVSAKYLIFTFCNVAAAFSPGWMPTYYLIGAIMNAVLTKILKVVFNQPRPERSPKQGRGMPSSHASAMAFFLVVMAAKVPSCVPIFDSHAIIAAVGIYVVLASYWRIVVHLHTVGQTIAGAFVGVAFACVWMLLEAALVADPHGEGAGRDLIAPLRARYADTTGPPMEMRVAILSFATVVIHYERRLRKYF